MLTALKVAMRKSLTFLLAVTVNAAMWKPFGEDACYLNISMTRAPSVAGW